MRLVNSVASTAALCVVAVALPSGLAAQSIWLEPQSDRSVYLEALKPSFEYSDLSFLTTSWYVSVRWPLGDRMLLVSELPFTYASIDNEFIDESATAFGNVYVGIEGDGSESAVHGEFGVRLPLAPSEGDGLMAAEVGAFADLVERWEAYLPDVLSIHAAVNYKSRSTPGLGLRLRLAPVLWIDTGDALRDDVELWALYSAQAWYDGEKVAAGAGFSGRLLATETDLDFGERTFHQIGMFVSMLFGRFQPGAQLRIPLDEDLSDTLNPSLSVSLGYRFP